MRKLTITAALAAVAIAVTVPLTFAQTGGYGMGPGMMGGFGGYDMGPGMMGGYGMGPEMMGNGMMGGYGMGPGHRGYGMGPGMMHGYHANAAGALDLTDDQREKIIKVQEALSTKRWELMGKMQEQQFKLRDLLASGNADDAAVGKAYKNIESLRQQIWASGADAQKQMDAVLTKEQRDRLQRGWGRGPN